MRIDKPFGDSPSGITAIQQRTVLLHIDDNGAITLTVRENDHERTYEFDSRESFQQQEPELYEKYNHLFEEAQSGTRLDFLEFAAV